MFPKVSVVVAVYESKEMALRAIDSIPDRDDIEAIIIDDCSKDNTYQLLMDNYGGRANYTILRNEKNIGSSFTLNRGIDLAKGEYYVQLDDDDIFYTEAMNKVIDMADMDLVWFNMQVNNGDVWSPNVMKEICDHGCLYRMSIVGKTRHPKRSFDSGVFFHREIISKPHTERYTNMIAYGYNFPRVGSQMDLANKGLWK